MTRDEYRKEAIKYSNKEFANRINFPMLLREMAVTLFIKEELSSDFALETKRRLQQLNEVGFTDE